MNNQSFSSRITKLFSLLSNETLLVHYDRILMYKELLEHTTEPELKDLHISVVTSVHSYYREIVLRNNNYELDTMYTVLEKWIPKIGKTIYSNPENVHSFSEEAIKIAKKIIKQHPQKYHRPYYHNVFGLLESPIVYTYFELIENDPDFNGIKLTDLFASIWDYISKHKMYTYFLQRLLQEIVDSIDVCLSGRFIRLVNVINGIDEFYNFFANIKEYNKSHIFHLLNVNVCMLDLENFPQNVEKCINTNVDLIEAIKTHKIPVEDMTQILQNYTKTPWTYSSITCTYSPYDNKI